jgi:hypothetical protein
VGNNTTVLLEIKWSFLRLLHDQKTMWSAITKNREEKHRSPNQGFVEQQDCQRTRLGPPSDKKWAKQNWGPRLGWKDEVSAQKVAPQRPDIFQPSMATRCVGLRDLKVGNIKAEPSHTVLPKLVVYKKTCLVLFPSDRTDYSYYLWLVIVERS